MSEWVLRTLGRRMPGSVLLLLLLVVALGRLLVFVVSHWWLSWPLMVAGLAWWFRPATVGGVTGGVALLAVLVLIAWSAFAPESFARRVADPVRGAIRARHYRRAWDEAVEGCGLVRAGIEPTLMSCRTTGGVDRLSVHMAPGQVAADWRDVAPRIASALGVRSVRVRPDGPRDVALLVRWREIRVHDPEVLDDAAVDAEVTETTEQLVAERQRGPFPRRPS